MSDYKTLATILLRVLGLAYIAFAFWCWLYSLLTIHYREPGALLAATLNNLLYVVAGLSLFFLSKRLAALVVRGLDRQ
jgi:hypothetical protein